MSNEKGKSLYQLTGDFLTVQDMLNNPEVDAEMIIDTLEAIELSIEQKAEGGIWLISDLEGLEAKYKTLKDRFGAAEKAMKNRKDRVKEYYKSAMEALGKTEIKTDLGKLRIQNNPQALKIFNESEIPPAYLTVIPEAFEPNKEAIKAAIKAGEDVPGCELTQGTSLRIG